jgi:hypothetical protein
LPQRAQRPQRTSYRLFAYSAIFAVNPIPWSLRSLPDYLRTKTNMFVSMLRRF